MRDFSHSGPHHIATASSSLYSSQPHGDQPTISAADIEYVPLRYLQLPPSAPAINDVITVSVE